MDGGSDDTDVDTEGRDGTDLGDFNTIGQTGPGTTLPSYGWSDVQNALNRLFGFSSGTDTVTGGSNTGGGNPGSILNALFGGDNRGIATAGFGLAALLSALNNRPPEPKVPRYVAAPVYNRALTAPLYMPQPADKKSESGQNIFTPHVGLPLFFNPNPFQFNPTEAAKKYGPTPQEIETGYQGYLTALDRLYDTLGTQPEIIMEKPAAGGGYLEGPGDGMSDSIKTYIAGGPTAQPARLSQGEFVIPADVVSGLGNGSSKAGAERLYGLMDTVRMARHNTTQQPPPIDIADLLKNV